MTTLYPDTVIQRVSHTLSAEVDGSVVMMDVEQGLYFGLKGSGAEIWSRLTHPVTVQELTESLCRDYEAPPEIIRQELLELLTDLANRRLLLVTP